MSDNSLGSKKTPELDNGAGNSQEKNDSNGLLREKKLAKGETLSALNSLKSQLSIDKKNAIKQNDSHEDANSFLETELEKIDLNAQKLEKLTKPSDNSSGLKKRIDVDAQKIIGANRTLAHQAIQDLGRPDATQGLQNAYDDAQSSVTDFMSMFLSGKDLGFFS